MKLYFVGGIASEIVIIKETKAYMIFRAIHNGMRYRLNKETGEVQNAIYHTAIKGLKVE